MTAKSNLNKIKKGQFDNIPEYRKLWEVYERDAFQGGKKKKKAGGKKK